jgi:hypothetical protein
MSFLTFWILLVNVFFNVYLIMVYGYKKFDFFMSFAYFLLNWLVLLLPLLLYLKYGQRFLQATFYGLLIGVLLPIVLHFAGLSSPVKYRTVLFFKNPNQLGYYSLLAATMVLLIRDQIKGIKPHYFLMLSLGCLYTAFLSVSMAALASVALLFVLDLVSRSKNRVRNIFSMFVLSVLIYGAVVSTTQGIAALDMFNIRLESKEAATSGRDARGSEYEKRNYERISNHPEYLVLGAGEGAYERFISWDPGNEIHSSFGTVAFCYGLPGTILLLMVIYLSMRHLKFLHQLYAMPIFLYGITHNGLRFSMFWVTIAVFAVLGLHRWIIMQSARKENQVVQSNELEAGFIA